MVSHAAALPLHSKKLEKQHGKEDDDDDDDDALAMAVAATTTTTASVDPTVSSTVRSTPFYVYMHKQLPHVNPVDAHIQRYAKIHQGMHDSTVKMIEQAASMSPTSSMNNDMLMSALRPDYFDLSYDMVHERSVSPVSMRKPGRHTSPSKKQDFADATIKDRTLHRSSIPDFSHVTSRDDNRSPMITRNTSVDKKSDVFYNVQVHDKVKGDPFIRSQVGREAANKVKQPLPQSPDKIYIGINEKYNHLARHHNNNSKNNIVESVYMSFDKQQGRDHSMETKQELELLQLIAKKKQQQQTSSHMDSSSNNGNKEASDVGHCKDTLLPRSPAFKFNTATRLSLEQTM